MHITKLDFPSLYSLVYNDGLLIDNDVI